MAWTQFVNSTTADADEVNGNFAFSDGDIVPHSQGTLANNEMNLGTTTALWKGLYVSSINAQSLVLSGTATFNGVATFNANVTCASNTLFVDSANKRVGVNNGSLGSAFSGAGNLVIGGGAGDEGMTIFTGATSTGRVLFSGGSIGAGEGAIRYDHLNETMDFFCDGSEVINFHKTTGVNILLGNLAVGHANASQTLDVNGTFAVSGAATFNSTATFNGPMTVNSTSTFNGVITTNNSLGIGVGSLTNDARLMVFGTGFTTSAIFIQRDQAGSNSDASLLFSRKGDDLSSSSMRAGTIYFSRENSSGAQVSGASIHAVSAGSMTDTSVPMSLRFTTSGGTAVGNSSLPDMIVTSGGLVGIQTINPSQTLDVNGTMAVSGVATFNGPMTVNSTSTFNGPPTFATLSTFNGQLVSNATSTLNGHVNIIGIGSDNFDIKRNIIRTFDYLKSAPTDFQAVATFVASASTTNEGGFFFQTDETVSPQHDYAMVAIKRNLVLALQEQSSTSIRNTSTSDYIKFYVHSNTFALLAPNGTSVAIAAW